MIDIHCHILPEIDDGPGNLKEAYEMMRLAYQDGIRVIFATSHYHTEMEEETWQRRRKALWMVRKAASAIGEDLQILEGAEIYYSQDVPQKLQEKKIWTMANSRYVLVEFAPYESYPYIQRAVQNLQYHGFLPVIAHIERYESLRKAERLEELADMGAYLQVNVSGILGKEGRQTKKFLKELLKQRLIHFVGTDGHGSKYRKPLMAKCAKYIKKKTDEEYSAALCGGNAKMIIRRNVLDA